MSSVHDLDGFDSVETREAGCRGILDNLGTFLAVYSS